MGQDSVISKRPKTTANQLVDAAAALLGERNSLDVSLSEISRRSGLNSALVKYYFRNKEGLLLAVLQRDASKTMKDLARLVEKQLSAEQKIRIHINGIINAYYRSPYLNRLIHYMIDSAGEDASAEVVKIFIEPMLSAYRAIIEQGVQEGSFRDVDPALFYLSLVGSCEHIFYAGYSVRPTLGITDMTEELKQRYTTHITDMCLKGVLETFAS